MIDQNSDLKEKLTRVFERAMQDAIALLLSHRESEKPSAEPILEWMTASQLARYWQLVNSNGEPGDLLRFHRADVDVWAREEADRRRAQNEHRRLRIA